MLPWIFLATVIDVLRRKLQLLIVSNENLKDSIDFFFKLLVFTISECRNIQSTSGKNLIGHVSLKASQLSEIHVGAIHTSELDRSEIDLSPKRSECERSNAN